MKIMKITIGLSLAVTALLLSTKALFGQDTNTTPVPLQPGPPIVQTSDGPSVPLVDPQINYSGVIIAGGGAITTSVPSNAVAPSPTLVYAAPIAPATVPASTPAAAVAVSPQTRPAFNRVPPWHQNRPIIVRPGPPMLAPSN